LANASEAVNSLWVEGYFSEKRSFSEIKVQVEILGCHPTASSLHKLLNRVDFLRRHGPKGNYRFAQTHPYNKLKLNEVLPQKLAQTLQKDFTVELADLKLVYGRSGTCTAFILRKILEKLIFIVFSKQGISDKLKYGSDFVGLKAMIELAQTEKINGVPFMMPKTAKEIAGIKFLGDTSAHNPLVTVDMETIAPAMPFIVTAYTELAREL